MSRPVHITALDEALRDGLTRLRDAENRHAEVLDAHAEALAEVAQAQKARSDAYYAVKDIESAIRRLGYVVLSPVAGDSIVPPDESVLDIHSGRFREHP